jgi:outer membrane receptor protein involved in Fe transport
MVARTWRFFALAAVLCWISALPALAQGNGRIEGRIVKQGKGVAGVVVLVLELRAVEVSDSSGEFVFKNVPPGIYNLNYTLGDSGENQAGIGVVAGETRTVELEVDWDLGVYEKVTVTAAAERAAKIVDAPAAVTSMVAEEIEKEAAHGQLPKVLEFTPGAEVTQSGLYDFNFNTRGFNSSLNRRVSTYIDGRDVGVVLLGAQEWAAIAGGLGDVASLDFIRGPSAALYGANASSGVVNITTKAPRNSLGSMVRVTAGDLNTLNVDFRQAQALGKGWYYKVLAGVRNSGDFTVSRNPDVVDEPEYSEFCSEFSEGTGTGSVVNCLPAEKTLPREQDNDIRFGSLRVDKYLKNDNVISLEAGTTDMEGPVFQTGIGRVQINEARRPFYRAAFSAPRWNVQAFYSERDGDQVNLNDALITRDELLSDTKRYAIEGQGNWDFFGGRARFVVGGAYTWEEVDTCCFEDGSQTVVVEEIDTDRQAIFTQFDWEQNEHLSFVLAGRMDWNTLHDPQFSPKAAMVYSINPNHSFRFTYNEAFQVANYSEFFLHARLTAVPFSLQQLCTLTGILGTAGQLGTVNPATGQVEFDPTASVGCDATFPGTYPLQNMELQDVSTYIPVIAVGNDDLRLEKTSAFEIGYSGLIGKRAFFTVDYYNSENEDFITDLIPQVTTPLGTPTAECLTSWSSPAAEIAATVEGRYASKVADCPINPDYTPWVSANGDWENTYRFDIIDGWSPLGDAILSQIESSVGRRGARLAVDVDGESAVIVARTYTNVGKVDTQGIDFGLQIFANDRWGIQASYSWFDFDIKDDVRVTAEEVGEILLPNTPEHKASMSVSYRRNRFQGTVSGRWVDEFYWSAGIFQGNVPAYYTTDVSASYQFNDMFALGLNVANATDNKHHQTFGGDLLERRALTNLAITW